MRRFIRRYLASVVGFTVLLAIAGGVAARIETASAAPRPPSAAKRCKAQTDRWTAGLSPNVPNDLDNIAAAFKNHSKGLAGLAGQDLARDARKAFADLPPVCVDPTGHYYQALTAEVAEGNALSLWPVPGQSALALRQAKIALAQTNALNNAVFRVNHPGALI